MQLDDYLWGIASIAPLFVVYLLAAILGLVNMRRHKQAAKFTALGGMIGVLVMIGGNVAHHLLWSQWNFLTDDLDAIIRVSRFIGIGSSLVHAVSLGMIVFAVFVGRKQVVRDERDPPDDRDGGEPLQRASRPPG